MNSGRRALWVEREDKDAEAGVGLGSSSRNREECDAVGRGRPESISRFAGHAKEPGFYPGSSGKPLEGFKQETEMILAYAFKELFGCCVESGEEKVFWKHTFSFLISALDQS